MKSLIHIMELRQQPALQHLQEVTNKEERTI